MERIIRDGGFRDRLIQARSLGISERRFLGWEPTEVHEHEYDDAGRLVRTIVTRESEWDDAERAKALALTTYEQGICGGCGLHHDIAKDGPRLGLIEKVCPVCVDLASGGRQMNERYEETLRLMGKNPPASARRPTDGLTLTYRIKPTDSQEVPHGRAPREGRS